MYLQVDWREEVKMGTKSQLVALMHLAVASSQLVIEIIFLYQGR